MCLQLKKAQFLTLHGVQELILNNVLQSAQNNVRTGCRVFGYGEVGSRLAGGGRGLEGAAKGVKERQQLGDGGQGALSEEGKLQVIRGGLLSQPVQCLKKQDTEICVISNLEWIIIIIN